MGELKTVDVSRRRKSKLQHEVFAKEMAKGSSIRQSMISAGYSPRQARKGMSALSKKMLNALAAEGYKLADFGKSLSLETLKNIAIGRIATNAINGSDRGVNSAKLIGTHKDINLWVAESQVGVIVLQTPTAIAENMSKLLEQEERKE